MSDWLTRMIGLRLKNAFTPLEKLTGMDLTSRSNLRGTRDVMLCSVFGQNIRLKCRTFCRI